MSRAGGTRKVQAVLEAFEEALGGRDPKTVRAYMTTLHDLVEWVRGKPGGKPFRLELLTETAIKGYMDHLRELGRAPRTRGKALSAMRRFCRWAVDEGHLRRNSAAQVERPTVTAVAPNELTEDQRYVLKTLVEQSGSRRLAAVFSLGYWAGLRVSEVASLRWDQCELTRRSGTITIVDSKGGKTRTLDLHNEARRALYAYVHEGDGEKDARDPDSDSIFTGQRSGWLRRHRQTDHLSSRGIEHLWTGLKRSATHDQWALIKDIRFHDLRHDWAHRARDAGWQLEEIAVYAGHQTKDGQPAIATTARYTLPSRKKLKERLQALRG